MRDSAVPGTIEISDQEYQDYIESLDTNGTLESELNITRHHTMIRKEEHYLDLAPAQRRVPEEVIYDTNAE